MWSDSTSALVIYKKKKTEVQDRALQEVQNEFVESRREQTRLQEELVRKENALRDTQIWSEHEMEKWRERKYNKMSSRFKNLEKITRLFNSSLSNCSNCKNRWILWTVLENSRILNQIVVEDCLTFPVNLRWFGVLVLNSAATKDCRSVHGIYPEYRKTFLEIHFPRRIHLEIFLKEFHLITCKEIEKPLASSAYGENKSDKWRRTKIMAQFQCRCVKTQNTLPPQFPSQPFHEVEVCRRREASEAKVTMGPFFDNRVDIIWSVPARERLVNIGTRPSANFVK